MFYLFRDGKEDDLYNVLPLTNYIIIRKFVNYLFWTQASSYILIYSTKFELNETLKPDV